MSLQDTLQYTIEHIQDFVENLPHYIETIATIPTRFLMFEVLIFVSLLLIFYKWDPYQLQSTNPLIVVQLLLLVFFFMMASFIFVQQRSELYDYSSAPAISLFLKKTSSTLLAGLSMIAIVIFIVWLVRTFKIAGTAMMWISNLVILAGAIGFMYLIFRNKRPEHRNKKQSTLLNGMKNLFLALPILFIRFIEMFKEELKLTSSTTTIVLAIEVTLIAVYFLSPYLMRAIIAHDGKNLLKEPIYLENRNVLSTHEQLYGKQDETFKYRYALSAWFTINPQPPSTRESYSKYTDILNYGNKPRVQFNSSKNTLRVQVQMDNDDIEDIYVAENAVPFQRWNHIVVNYDGGNMDVFLNGILVGSKPNIAPYMEYDNVISGHDKGLEGGVCNVTYYDRILTNSEISLEYNLLQGSSIPLL